VAVGSAGAEILGPALLNAASLPFPLLATLAGTVADLGPGPKEAVLPPRLGTAGDRERLNRMVRDAAKQAGLTDAQRDILHEELHLQQAIDEHAFTYREIKELALRIARGIH